MEENAEEINSVVKRLVFYVAVLLCLMYVSMGYAMFGLPLPKVLEKSDSAVALLQLLLSASIMVANQKFFVNGFKGIINRSPNMDSLVALGSFSAFLYSTVMLFDMLTGGKSHLHGLYFEAAAMVLTLITIGKMLVK